MKYNSSFTICHFQRFSPPNELSHALKKVTVNPQSHIYSYKSVTHRYHSFPYLSNKLYDFSARNIEESSDCGGSELYDFSTQGMLKIRATMVAVILELTGLSSDFSVLLTSIATKLVTMLHAYIYNYICR